MACPAVRSMSMNPKDKSVLADELEKASQDICGSPLEEAAPIARLMAEAAIALRSSPAMDHSQRMAGRMGAEFVTRPEPTPSDGLAGEYPDNTYTPYGRRSVANLAKLLEIESEKPTVVSVINRAYDQIVFLSALHRIPDTREAVLEEAARVAEGFPEYTDTPWTRPAVLSDDDDDIWLPEGHGYTRRFTKPAAIAAAIRALSNPTKPVDEGES